MCHCAWRHISEGSNLDNECREIANLTYKMAGLLIIRTSMAFEHFQCLVFQKWKIQTAFRKLRPGQEIDSSSTYQIQLIRIVPTRGSKQVNCPKHCVHLNTKLWTDSKDWVVLNAIYHHFFPWRSSPNRAYATSFLGFLDRTQTHTQPIGLLWASGQLVAETATCTKNTRDEYPCRQRDSNPWSLRPHSHWDRLHHHKNPIRLEWLILSLVCNLRTHGRNRSFIMQDTGLSSYRRFECWFSSCYQVTDFSYADRILNWDRIQVENNKIYVKAISRMLTRVEASREYRVYQIYLKQRLVAIM
jgi:hypothetical protein